MRVVPAPDRLVRDPQTGRQVDADGITIEPTDLYWARLLADGDVVEAPADPAPSAPSKER
jgi:hypothetical protein